MRGIIERNDWSCSDCGAFSRTERSGLLDAPRQPKCGNCGSDNVTNGAYDEQEA